MKKEVVAIDLFCGAGGLTHGLELAGVNVKAGYDIDKNCEFPYSTNNSATFYHSDIKDISGEEIKKLWGEGCYTLLAGCAPCQPFSNYMIGKDSKNKEEKWGMLYEFERLVEESQPDFITMENVPSLAKRDVFRSFFKTLVLLGYKVDYEVVNCADYGVPQNRKRLVLMASKISSITVPKKTNNKAVTVKQSIEKLPEVKHGESDKFDSLHRASKLNKINVKRIQQSKPGGSWKDWDEELITPCHKKKSGERYQSVYGRMSWESPAPTMTTQCFGYGNGRFGHPTQDRAITLREAAIFQSFPLDYKFVPKGKNVIMKTIGRLIGNAVPVKLGEVIGKTIIQATSVSS